LGRVFIGGSRKVVRLAPEVRARLDRIIAKNLPVLVGDANGADKAVQRYLSDRGYPQVEVFCSDPTPRNNVGAWPVHPVRPDHRRKDFDYYATKDRAMAAEATVGLMLWDGEKLTPERFRDEVRLAAAVKLRPLVREVALQNHRLNLPSGNGRSGLEPPRYFAIVSGSPAVPAVSRLRVWARPKSQGRPAGWAESTSALPSVVDSRGTLSPSS
jgi:hypothetical protein